MKNFVESQGFDYISDGVEDLLLEQLVYYRMRGRKVTPLQAFDIISKTDYKLTGDEYGIFTGYWLLSTPNLGIVRPDGYLGRNNITYSTDSKRIADFIPDVIKLKQSFPYLDFVIAFTNWKVKLYSYHSYKDYDSGYKYFDDAIVAGILVHGNKIHLLNAANAKEAYKHYNITYGHRNELIFSKDYYSLDDNLFPKGYLTTLLQTSAGQIELREPPYLRCDSTILLEPEYNFMCQMITMYKNTDDKKKFDAWIISQFLYDAEELGYSIEDAWKLMVNSKVGKAFLSGEAEDMNANEADAEMGRFFLKKHDFYEYLPSELIDDINVLLEIKDGYGLSLESAFYFVDYFTFSMAVDFDGVTLAEIYTLLIGECAVEDVLPTRIE